MKDFKDHSKASKCPLNFPDLEKHPNENHGDVCRKDMINGYDIGWNCPIGCTAPDPVPDAMPYCKMSPSDNAPCRISSKFIHVFFKFSHLLLKINVNSSEKNIFVIF